MDKESNLRSITKATSYRILATSTTIIIVYLFFGRLDLALAAGATETILKILLFYLHERFWQKVTWGRGKE